MQSFLDQTAGAFQHLLSFTKHLLIFGNLFRKYPLNQILVAKYQILVTVQQTKSSDQLPTSKKEEIFRWQFV